MVDPDGIYRIIVCPASQLYTRYNNGSIVALDDGTLLLVYQCWYTSGSADASPGRVEGKLSSDRGRTWGAESIIKESYDSERSGGGRRIGSPSLLRFASGQLLLFHDIMNSDDDHRNYLSRSNDNGLIWSESVPIVGKLGYYVINNDRAIRLSSGRILVPVADHGVTFRRHAISFGLYSDDDGRTWTRGSSDVDVDGEAGAQEPGVVELKDGRVLMNIRTSLGQAYKCYSEDEGSTWLPPEPMGIQSPRSPQTIRRIPSTGDLLMVWNNAPGPVRAPLTLAVSPDEGITWERFQDIDGQEGHTYAYPSIFFQDDEVILTYYDHNALTKHGESVAEITKTNAPGHGSWLGRISLKLAIVPIPRIYSH